MTSLSRMHTTLFATALACLGSTAHAIEDVGRIDLGIALEQMTSDACARAYAQHEDLVAHCKAEHFDQRTHDRQYLWEQGDEGDRQCLLVGGVLTKHMPPCVDAMTALLVAGRDNNTSAVLHALGDYISVCGAQALCVETDENMLSST